MIENFVEVYEVGEKHIGIEKFWNRGDEMIEAHWLSIFPKDLLCKKPYGI